MLAFRGEGEGILEGDRRWFPGFTTDDGFGGTRPDLLWGVVILGILLLVGVQYFGFVHFALCTSFVVTKRKTKDTCSASDDRSVNSSTLATDSPFSTFFFSNLRCTIENQTIATNSNILKPNSGEAFSSFIVSRYLQRHRPLKCLIYYYGHGRLAYTIL